VYFNLIMDEIKKEYVIEIDINQVNRKTRLTAFEIASEQKDTRIAEYMKQRGAHKNRNWDDFRYRLPV